MKETLPGTAVVVEVGVAVAAARTPFHHKGPQPFGFDLKTNGFFFLL